MASFEIRQIDAWGCKEDGWYYNNTYHVGEFTTRWKDEKRAFLYHLHKLGIMFQRGKTTVVDCGDLYEVQERKTGRPLYAAMPIQQL